MRDHAVRSLAWADSAAGRVQRDNLSAGWPLADAAGHVAHPAKRSGQRCRVPDPLQALPAHLDQYTDIVRAAARGGLLPVAPLVDDALRQVREHLWRPERDPMLSREPPAGWDGAAAWQAEVEEVVGDEIRPAIGRYADLLAELLPRSRPPERAGLLYVPGGVAAYACSVRVGTTLPLDPDEIHRTGLVALAEIEDAIAELGRDALGARSATEAMAAARLHSVVSRRGRRDVSRRRRGRPGAGMPRRAVP